MANPVPTLDQVLDAVAARLLALDPSVGTVLHFEDRYDDPTEALDEYRADDGTVDVWHVGATVDAREGPSAGEKYSLYRVTARYRCVRLEGEEEWSRQALAVAERARTQLEGASSVFAIGGQRQFTDETVTVDAGFVDVGGQKVYQCELRFTVEGRRWS